MNQIDIKQFDTSSSLHIRQCLGEMLVSDAFSASPRQQRLLQYLVDKAISGHSESLKGYTIGVEVFDRGMDFDPVSDSIVRVEIGRLRSKLQAYYGVEGRNAPVRFEVPKGGYSLRITFHEQVTQPIHHADEGKPSLAVLPFANYSVDHPNTYFADGITDSLIFELSNFSGLFLVSRQSSFAYREKPLRTDEIGMQLGVRYLLEGSIQRADNRVRITVQLTDTLSGGILWTERYDREIENIFALQDEITQNVVKMLRIKLTPSETGKFGHEGTTSLDAYDKLLQGLEQYWKYTLTSVDQAIRHFQGAVVHDPDYAIAHAWLSRAMAFEWIMCWKNDDEILERAYEHARAAVQLNKYLPHTFLALGWVQLWRKNGPEAIAACRNAVALDPNSADGFMFLSMSLSSMGAGEEALEHMKVCMRLSPYPNPFHLYVMGQALYVMGDYAQAISVMERGAALSDMFMPNHFFLCLLYTLTGRHEDSRKKRDETYAKIGGRHAPVRPPWIEPTLMARHEALVIESGLAYSNK